MLSKYNSDYKVSGKRIDKYMISKELIRRKFK